MNRANRLCFQHTVTIYSALSTTKVPHCHLTRVSTQADRISTLCVNLEAHASGSNKIVNDLPQAKIEQCSVVVEWFLLLAVLIVIHRLAIFREPMNEIFHGMERGKCHSILRECFGGVSSRI